MYDQPGQIVGRAQLPQSGNGERYTPAPAWLSSRGRGPPPSGYRHPEPGDLFNIDSGYPGFKDVHRDSWRPVAVVAVVDAIKRVRIVSRTTDLDEPGVRHDPVPDVGLRKPGVFAARWVQLLDLPYFVPPLVEFLTQLDDTTRARVIEMVNSQ